MQSEGHTPQYEDLLTPVDAESEFPPYFIGAALVIEAQSDNGVGQWLSTDMRLQSGRTNG